jgi:ribosomal protein L13E
MSASNKKKGKPKAASAKVKSKAKVSKTKRAEKKAPVAKPKRTAPKPKRAEEKKVAPKAMVRAEPVKMGPAPVAVVAARHIDSLRERAARGFSFGELSSAGIPLEAAKRQDLSVDVRRRSVVDQNVEALKSWFKHPVPVSSKDAAVDQVAVAAVSKKRQQ